MGKMFITAVAMTLAALLAVPASAQSPITPYVGVGFGKMIEDGAPGGSVGVAGGIMYELTGMPLTLGAEAGYVLLGTTDSDISLSVIPITGQVYYMIPTSGDIGPYLEAGAGLYNMRASNGDSTSDTKAGLNFGGGIKIKMPDSKFSFGADAKLHIVLTEDESTKLLTIFARAYFE